MFEHVIMTDNDRSDSKYMREHTMENEIWDEGQLAAVEGVLGTMDQLIIDRCIMEEVKHYHRNLAVALYDYKKAYDKVSHDWMLRVYHWIGIPKEVNTLISQLMEKWKTRLEIWSRGEKLTSRWIDISCGFLLFASWLLYLRNTGLLVIATK